MRNSNTKIAHSIKSIGCPHIHTYTLTQSKINVCFNCLIIYYSNCEYRKIEGKEETIQSIKILQTYFDDIKITAQNNRLDILFSSIFDELNAFTSDLDLLSNRLEIAIKHNNFIEFSDVKEEALNLMQKLENSQTMSVYSKHQAHSLLDKSVNGFSEIYNLPNSHNSKDKNILPEIDQPHNSKEETKASTTNNHTTMKENYEEKVDELTSKIYSLAEEKKTLESTVQNLIKSNKEVKEKYIRLESKMENFHSLYIERERIIENLEEGISTSPYSIVFDLCN